MKCPYLKSVRLKEGGIGYYCINENCFTQQTPPHLKPILHNNVVKECIKGKEYCPHPKYIDYEMKEIVHN